jgi:hypothetical protein
MGEKCNEKVFLAQNNHSSCMVAWGVHVYYGQLIARTTMSTFGPSTRATYEVLYLTHLLLYMKGITP